MPPYTLDQSQIADLVPRPAAELNTFTSVAYDAYIAGIATKPPAYDNTKQVFALFSEFPKEIQGAIWAFSYPGPRAIMIGYGDGKPAKIGRGERIGKPKPIHVDVPALLHVCQISRAVFLLNYKPIFLATLNPRRPVYFNFNKDVLIVEDAELLHKMYTQHYTEFEGKADSDKLNDEMAQVMKLVRCMIVGGRFLPKELCRDFFPKTVIETLHLQRGGFNDSSDRRDTTVPQDKVVLHRKLAIEAGDEGIKYHGARFVALMSKEEISETAVVFNRNSHNLPRSAEPYSRVCHLTAKPLPSTMPEYCITKNSKGNPWQSMRGYGNENGD